VPNLTFNLLSITKALKGEFKTSNQRKTLELKQDKCVIKFDKIRNKNKSYSPGIHMKARKHYEMTNATITNRNVKYEMAHHLLGHPGHDTTRAMALKLGWTISQEKEPCMSCSIGKAQQKNLNQVAGRLSEKPRQVFASDISTIASKSSEGKQY
jgi:hypothetical protein